MHHITQMYSLCCCHKGDRNNTAQSTDRPILNLREKGGFRFSQNKQERKYIRIDLYFTDGSKKSEPSCTQIA